MSENSEGSATAQGLGEFEIIARFFSRIGRRSDVLLGVGDDAAILDVPTGERLVAAVDTIVADVHFPAGLDPADVGWRALAVNLSDLAAMGARPAWATLSLSLPGADAAWLNGFAQGFAELAALWDVALVGGDTVRGPLVITVQVLGLVEQDGWLTRSGARAGDLVIVSGTPGDAAAGLAAWRRSGPHAPGERTLIERFTRPVPRVELGRQLRRVAHAAMDVSDGLAADLEKLCIASGCAAEVDLDALPLSEALCAVESRDRDRCARYALSGGDDYELIFTMPPGAYAELIAREHLAVDCTPIGRIRSGRGVTCLRDGAEFRIPAGYDHFGADRGE